MIIRKISVGADYKSSSMHYLVGQSILGGSYKIHHIRMEENGSYKIWIDNGGEVFLWKEFGKNMPVSVEYLIDF